MPQTRTDLESMLASPPGEGGVRAVIAVRPASPDAAPAIRSMVGAAGICVDDGGAILILRSAASETEAWVWCERIRRQLGEASAIGFAVPANSRDALAIACEALALAESRTPRFCSASAADIIRIAGDIASDDDLGAAERRMRLLRKIIFRLGPIQAEHVTGHCEQVGRTAARLAQLMNLPSEAAEDARLAGLLHDIGKAAYPEELLAKRQGLSPDERALLARHAGESAAIAAALGIDEAICRAVARHHDRFDTGAPDQTARIVCVADALVTMTTARAYSPARTMTEALTELRRGRGTLFDPAAVVAAHLFGASAMSLAA